MVAARIPFGQYNPIRNQYNLGFNNHYPTWGSYDQWRALVPQYEAYRKTQVKVNAHDLINYVGSIFYYVLFTTILSSLLQTVKVLKSVFLK